MLSQEQIRFFHENGYVRIPQVFAPEEMQTLSDELDRVIQDWAETNKGWTGPWRQIYLSADIEQGSLLTHANDFHIHSAAWCRAVFHPHLVETMSSLLGPYVEMHHTTLHC